MDRSLSIEESLMALVLLKSFTYISSLRGLLFQLPSLLYMMSYLFKAEKFLVKLIFRFLT